MSDDAVWDSFQDDRLRTLVPVFAVAVAVLAGLTDPASTADLLLAVPVVVAFATWAFVPRVPLPVVALAVLVPVVLAQRSGALEPLMFEASLLGYVVGRWAPSFAVATLLGAGAVAAPIVASVLQNPSKLAVGIWILGITFPWLIGRAAARQRILAARLHGAQRELAHQALLGERRRIARDVHDLVGHGLAAVMLQITSARHVLRRDPEAAEEALRSAEEVGRRSMRELRNTVALLRSDDESTTSALPSAGEIRALVDDARAGGLMVELQAHGDLTRISAGAGVALYRIAQEALANAAKHAPRSRTSVEIDVDDRRAELVVETTGAASPEPAADPDRPRFGLLGMRERATALGGEFAAGPTAAGWRVSCRLPLDARGEALAPEMETL